MIDKKYDIDPAIDLLEDIIASREYRLRRWTGDISITRDANNYITQIAITKGGWTRTIMISRDANNYITSIRETQTKNK